MPNKSGSSITIEYAYYTHLFFSSLHFFSLFFFSSVGGGSISTLVACELLSDVHELCAARSDGDELTGLRKYLVAERGWRSLAVLHLLGVRGLSCGRELVALLVALYPVAFHESSEPVPANPYVRFHCNDDTVDTVDIIPHKKRKSSTKIRPISDDSQSSRKRSRKHSTVLARAALLQRQKNSIETKKSKENVSSESEMLTDGIDQARSLTLKIRLNPMDFEYFTSVIRSDEEQRWEATLYELPPRPIRKTWQDFVDDRIKSVLDCRMSHFETSLLIIQLLQGLRDYATPSEQTPAVQVLKFALDTLWALQFGIDGANLTGTESATLKAAAARLMLGAMERVLRADEPTTAVIHNGLLPMTLRLLEDACSKPVTVLSPEEGSLLQEFIFATTYGIVTFLYCLLHQRGTTEKLKDFLELFQLFTESQDGKLVERTILAIVDLPSVDQARSVTRARKVIDMIGALTSALKRVRQDLCHMGQCHRSRHRSCADGIEAHHHFDILGVAYEEPTVGCIAKQACCISSLFMTMTSLTKAHEAHSFSTELQVRLLKVMTAAGTCCCFPPKALLSSIVAFLKKRIPQTYGPSVALLERTLFKELGAYPGPDTCNTCSKPTNYAWDFLEMYSDLLVPEDPKLCHVIMAHLLKVTPNASFHVRREMLFRVFYPTFLNAKISYTEGSKDSAAEFLIQSCLSVVSSLIINAPMCERFTEMNGLEDALRLLPNPVFTRHVYTLLEVTVIMEIWKSVCEDPIELRISEAPALAALFEALERETSELLNLLENLKGGTADDIIDEPRQKLRLKTKKSSSQESGWSQLNRSGEKIYLYSERVKSTEKSFAKNENLSSCGGQKDSECDELLRIGEDKKFREDLTGQKDKFGGESEENVRRKVCLFQASAAWRAAAGVALSSPRFREELSRHALSEKAMRLFKVLAVLIATDRIKGKLHTCNSLFLVTVIAIGWGTKFGMIKCRATDIPKIQNYEY